MMLALGVLDLPFEAPKHTTLAEGAQFTFTAGGAALVFHKEIASAEAAPGQTELLVSENFFRQSDRYRQEGAERFDKYVTDEFLSGVVYGANVVVTNPTSSPRKIELLLQIPQGALPVLGSKPTDSKRLRLEPYTTQTLEYFFYFPVPGEAPFAHYPAHVSADGKALGAARTGAAGEAGKPLAFTVVRKLSQIDTTSWEYVSQYGSDEEVFAFLDTHNLGRVALEKIAWRVRASADFFRRIIAVLEKRHVWNDTIYSYAVLHGDRGALVKWLRHRDDFLRECGPALQSPLLTIDPTERHAYEHLEYAPLINQRTHRLGSENKIVNPALRGQYQALLRILAHRPALDAADGMSVVYYLFAQDRVEEALARLHAIPAEALPTRLQHDYFRCYAAFYEEQLAEARGIASQHAGEPVERWRKLFTEVLAQLDEIEGKAAAPRDGKISGAESSAGARDVQQAQLATTEPTFDFKIEEQRIALTWRNLREVTVNFYLDPLLDHHADEDDAAGAAGRAGHAGRAAARRVSACKRARGDPRRGSAQGAGAPREFPEAHARGELRASRSARGGCEPGGVEGVCESLCALEERAGALFQGWLHGPAWAVRLRKLKFECGCRRAAAHDAGRQCWERRHRLRSPDAPPARDRRSGEARDPDPERRARHRGARGEAAGGVSLKWLLA